MTDEDDVELEDLNALARTMNRVDELEARKNELVEAQAELSNRVERLERENDQLEQRVSLLEKREAEQ